MFDRKPVLRVGDGWRARLVIAVAAALVAASAGAPSLAAGATLPGPASFARGLSDDGVFQSPIASERALWYRHARTVGASWVRLTVDWNAVAPTVRPRGFRAADPADRAYDFQLLDASLRSASASGTRVLLQLVGAPTWAEGAHMPRSAAPGSWRPNAAAFAAFTRAVALRYDGRFPDPLRRGRFLPRVSTFQIWNEPNLPLYITPQWTRTRHGFVPASPGIYRNLLNAAYAAIKAVQRHAEIVSGGTAPYGDPPGVDRMHPAVFLASLLCQTWPALKPLPCPHPAHFDILDHHPYSLTPYISAFNQADVGVPNMARLERIVRAAVRSGRLLPRGPKPTWVTEVSWDSDPPDPGAHLSRAGQARYAGYGLYSLWSQDVSNVFWFQFQDVDNVDNFLQGSGLYSLAGALKPAGAEFAFPFVALRRPGGATLWGNAPRAGTVLVEVRRGRRWQRLTTVRTTGGGIFYRIVHAPARLLLRATEGRAVSVPWQTA